MSEPGNSGFSRRCLKIAADMLQNPTAPLREAAMQGYLRAFVRRHPALALHEDRAGNVVVRYVSPDAGRRAPLVMAAHLDHPGFWVEEVSGRSARLLFKGGVLKPHARAGTRVRFYEGVRRKPTGSGRLTAVRYENGRLASARARIVEGAARAGGFAMWDLPAMEVRGGFIVSRACDDPLGAAAALCALGEVARRKPKGVALWGLFTRCEELGFFGALEAIRLRTVPRNAAVLSLETSKALANAPQGGGVILRVGDYGSIFSPDLTGAVWQAATRLAAKDRSFKCQRRLMDGGTCEATAFCATGYRASGLALALGNYHNQAFGARGSTARLSSPKSSSRRSERVEGRRRPEIGSETVSVADFLSEVRLLVELALHPEALRKTPGLPAWLKIRMRAAREALSKPAAHDRSAVLTDL